MNMQKREIIAFIKFKIIAFFARDYEWLECEIFFIIQFNVHKSD
jgi:hypothetical protein